MISRLRSFIKRLKSMSFSRMNMYIEQIHRESGRSRVVTFIDMCICALKYGIGYLEYRVYGFEYIRGRKKRGTFMNMARNKAIIAAYNDRETADRLFEDKAGFLERFREYCGRSWLDLRKNGEDQFAEFIKNNTTVFAKPLDDYGGHGIVKINCATCDITEAYQELTSTGRMLLEEGIVQHPEMQRLNSSSINTLRMVTIVDGKGIPHLIYTILRMGRAGTVVDNISSGGLYTRVKEDGTLYPGAFCDFDGKVYTAHPDSGIVFADTEIPMYGEAVSMCLKAALEVPQVRYVGWDVAITEKGPCFVEGNPMPSYDMVQNYCFQNGSGEGIYKDIERFL